MSATTVSGNQPIQMLPDEKRVLAMDFVNYGLAVGETLSGPAVLTITGKGFTAGAEISAGATSISGTQVSFTVTLTAAKVSAIYFMKVSCPTSAGNVAEGIRRLEIIQEG